MDRTRYQEKLPLPEMMLAGLRSIGYEFETAVADIIDNCVAAQASHVDVFFDACCSEPFFAICDDGTGMSDSELDSAMDFGTYKDRSFTNPKDLGRFGLGLKTASLSQCRRFYVVTKKIGIVLGSCWDLDHIIATKKWSLINLTDAEIAALPHVDYLSDKESGTIVIWENFDKIRDSSSDLASTLTSRANSSEDYCSLVFHRFYNSIQISFNGHRVKKMDPFLDGFDNVVALNPEKVLYNGSTITIQAYRMPAASDLSQEEKDLIGGVDSLKSDQGLYLYRNNRLILWGKWLRLEHKSLYTHLARVKVDIPATLDKEWSLDVKKSTAIIPDDIRKKMWAPINDGLEQSTRRVRYDGEQEVSTGLERIWIRKMLPDKQVTYSLNQDYPVIANLYEVLTSDQKHLLSSYLRDVENYIPTAKMRDDVSDQLEVINGKSNSEKDDLRKDLISTIRSMAGGDKEGIHKLLEIFLRFEKYAPLANEQKKLEEECISGS
jgi:hypothetical protein